MSTKFLIFAVALVTCATFQGAVEGVPLRGIVPTLPNNGFQYFGNNPFSHFAEEQGSQDEMAKTFLNAFSSILSAISKKVDNGEIQSADQFGKVFSGVLSSLLSAAEKKVDPKDELAKTVLNGFQSLVSQLGNSRSEAAEMESLLDKKLTDKEAEEERFDWGQVVAPIANQLISRAIGGSKETDAAIESLLDRKLTDEEMAEEQFDWGQIVAPIAGQLISRAVGGSRDTDAVIEAFTRLPQEAKEQIWGNLAAGLVSHLVSRAIDGSREGAAIEGLPQEVEEQFWPQLLAGVGTHFISKQLG